MKYRRGENMDLWIVKDYGPHKITDLRKKYSITSTQNLPDTNGVNQTTPKIILQGTSGTNPGAEITGGLYPVEH